MGGSKAWVRALTAMAGMADGRALPQRLRDGAALHGARPALLDHAGTLTHAALAARVNQYGHWAREQGVRPGDVVAVLMPNCAEYAAIWLGISGVGGVVALLNTSLRGAALAHAITLVSPRHVIAAETLADAVPSPPGMTRWVTDGQREGWRTLDRSAQPEEPPPGPHPALQDPALHIYTSGTTGLPKAVHITHGRVLEWSLWFAAMMDLRPEDRLYDCLPMYHSIGGVVAVGAPLMAGASVLIRPGFSARAFWDDVTDHDCTVFQYIGELCRYLLNTPPHAKERSHALRLACGNGLQDAVWPRFTQRFAIPHVLEYYAATEGSVSLYNTDELPGAIGRVPPYLAHRFPVALLRLDDAGQPRRGPDGWCERAAPDEPGEAIGPAPARLYTDPAASEAKILRDVFQPGDAWFRTGDLLRRDRAGHFRFVDRMGDTYRWKGENVSTAEVAALLGTCPGVTDITVYGVAVPGAEGRAGMAALVVTDGFDLMQFHAHAEAGLPAYARPLFLRLLPALEQTGTFKPQKAGLVADGYDPARVEDALFVLDRTARRYVPHPAREEPPQA